ncbi:MAG TPA: FKBP-type peptidyl-prolyl cis-trans isomerase [Hymenobacter sp.]|jgi:FKBP-type peptidyl-prolyl cis-trans isomerase|uniref:FKBP-type peptidyl-prolyl cis-trans isomerase n=1 Tax=Hymenobacter sp. TaxID=1898978 RepID=UPI002ED8EB75
MKNILLRSRLLVWAAGLLLAAPALWSCNSETAYQKQLREHDEVMRRIDEDTIRNYLTRNNLLTKATRTNSGLYVVPLADGTGPAVTSGKRVRVKYIGRFLSNGAQPGSSGYPASPGSTSFPAGAIFDNSADNRTECKCVTFTAGSGNIAGFNEGLLLTRQGDRKLLLIPSRLAYGTTGQQGSIPPDAALLFEVEILEVL